MRISTIVSALEIACVSYACGYSRKIIVRRGRQMAKFRRRIVGSYQAMMHRLIDVSSDLNQYARMLSQKMR